MKHFRVPIKSCILDYSNTKNLWLTLNDCEKKFDYFRADNTNQLLFGIGVTKFVQNPVPLDYTSEDKNRDVSSLYKKIIDDKTFTGDVFLVNSESKTLKYSVKTDNIYIAFKRKSKKFIVLNKETGEIALEADDFLLGLDTPINDSILKRIENEIIQSTSISYALMDELTTIMDAHNVDSYPLFIINLSPAECYAFRIKSTLNAVSLTIDMIKNKVLKYHYEKVWKIETVLHEALVNAITYGNELDDRKLVYVFYEVGKQGLRLLIRDEGEGFDVTNFSVPVGKDALDKVSGRGIYIMKKFATAIFFNQIGNETMLFFEF
jgi:serine/threonine-protein kinase RsbW